MKRQRFSCVVRHDIEKIFKPFSKVNNTLTEVAEKWKQALIHVEIQEQPGKKHQLQRPVLLNIWYYLILWLDVVCHTEEEISGWCAKFVNISFTVIFSCSNLDFF